MKQCYAVKATESFFPEPEENIMNSLLKQYEAVIVESVITAFGLDAFITDRHGGDVDTIHNVRRIDTDENMYYKNKTNQIDYENHGEYTKAEKARYDSDSRFIEINREFSEQKKEGTLVDAYTGQKVAINADIDLDHVISTKEIHDDRGRVLSGLSGMELANSKENLLPTDRSINRSMKEKAIGEYIEWLEQREPERSKELAILRAKSDLTDKERKRLHKYEQQALIKKEQMKKHDAVARKSYEKKLAQAYYTSPQFLRDTAKAAGKLGLQMGIRQAVGFIFVEIWFGVKEEMEKAKEDFSLEAFLRAIGNGISKGFENAKKKYRQLLEKLGQGALAGALSSLTTTLCNIFFTTAKNTVRLIRQTYASLVEAFKVLLLNPDNLPFGERMRAVLKIIATAASVAVGVLVDEAVSKTPIGTVPIVGEIVPAFCGSFVTGIMCCTLLYFMDRSELMNTLTKKLNAISDIDADVEFFRKQAVYFEQYAAELMQIDFEKFKNEVSVYKNAVVQIQGADTDKRLNAVLKTTIQQLGGVIPWEGDFDSFMSDKTQRLRFE